MRKLKVGRRPLYADSYECTGNMTLINTENTTLDRSHIAVPDPSADDDLTVRASTSTADVDVRYLPIHRTLVPGIAKPFGVTFSDSALAKLRNVGELVDFVDDRRVTQQV